MFHDANHDSNCCCYLVCRACQGCRLQRPHTAGDSEGPADVGDAAAPVADAHDTLFAMASLGMD